MRQSVGDLARIRSHLATKSVRGEHLERDEERRWLDELGQAKEREALLFLYRSMAIAEKLGLGDLTAAELDEIGSMLRVRSVLAEFVENGAIVERHGQDGTVWYRGVAEKANSLSRNVRDGAN